MFHLNTSKPQVRDEPEQVRPAASRLSEVSAEDPKLIASLAGAGPLLPPRRGEMRARSSAAWEVSSPCLATCCTSARACRWNRAWKKEAEPGSGAA